jgi:hypothetical protein
VYLPDRRSGIRFATDHGKVTNFYAGTAQAIQYIEGCLRTLIIQPCGNFGALAFSHSRIAGTVILAIRIGSGVYLLHAHIADCVACLTARKFASLRLGRLVYGAQCSLPTRLEA